MTHSLQEADRRRELGVCGHAGPRTPRDHHGSQVAGEDRERHEGNSLLSFIYLRLRIGWDH